MSSPLLLYVYDGLGYFRNCRSLELDPLGLRIALDQIYDQYHLPMFVVENGLGASDQIKEDGSVHDSYREKYPSDAGSRLIQESSYCNPPKPVL